MMSSVTENCAGNELIIEKKIISRLYKRFLRKWRMGAIGRKC